MPIQPSAIRLLCHYDATGVTVSHRVAIEKLLLPTEDLAAPLDPAVLTAELRSAADDTRYRRTDPVLLAAGREFHGAPESPRRTPDTAPTGVFTLVMPADPSARDVVLLAVAARLPDVLAGRAGTSIVPVEICRFRLHPEPVG